MAHPVICWWSPKVYSWRTASTPPAAVVSGDPVRVAQSVGADTGFLRAAFSLSEAGVLAYRSGAATRRQLVWVDRAGNTLGVLGPPEETGLSDPRLAPDGRLLAVSRNIQGNRDVWLIDVARAITSRFTFNLAVDGSGVWSPDGSRLIFRSARNSGVFGLFEKPASGAADEQPLLVTAQNKSPADWSPDGRVLLYTTNDPKNAVGPLDVAPDG
jgi:eukaryotic-like serine/threonine-protein kinase